MVKNKEILIKLRNVFIAIISISFVIALVYFIISNNKKQNEIIVDFNDFKVFEATGGELNSDATLTGEIKNEEVLNKLEEINKEINKKSEKYLDLENKGKTKEAKKISEELNELYELRSNIYGECKTGSDVKKLENGDEITYSCIVNSKLASKYGVRFVNTVLTYEVSGLNEITEIKIFGGIAVKNSKVVDMKEKTVNYEPSVISNSTIYKSEDFKIERIDENTVRVYSSPIYLFERAKQKVVDADGEENERYYKDYELATRESETF